MVCRTAKNKDRETDHAKYEKDDSKMLGLEKETDVTTFKLLQVLGRTRRDFNRLACQCKVI